MTLAEYAEQRGNERLKFELESKANLHGEARFLFTMIAAAMAGCLGYAFTLLREKDTTALLIITATTTIHLAMVAIYTLKRPLGIKDLAPLGNEPLKFIEEENASFSLDEVLKAECANIQASIAQNLEINRETARSIIRARRALVATPLSSISAWAVCLLADLA